LPRRSTSWNLATPGRPRPRLSLLSSEREGKKIVIFKIEARFKDPRTKTETIFQWSCFQY
jgi:hypothetical protein